MTAWRETSCAARLEEILPDGRVRCLITPRHCEMREGQRGFCGVRMNRGGRLVTLNYGKSVHATQETIETEAVNHFAPGEPILSLGNIGCMLNCAYCQNWKTSQAKHVSDDDVFYYTPRDVIDMALRHGIRVLSWTYNDPVVWHEFVLDTSILAKEAGLVTLYKSAFYITVEAVDELLPYMDIFSISLKSMDEQYYRKWTTGRLQPVLDATKHVHRAGKHVEVSTLMITDVSDNETTATQVSDWVLRELDSRVPVHFVRFHPDYKYTDTVRTPIDRLIRAREIGKGMGLEHVYIGNIFDPRFSNTYCNGCGALLVSRYGLNSQLADVDSRGHCRKCGRDAHIKLLPERQGSGVSALVPDLATAEVKAFAWSSEVNSIHVQVHNDGGNTTAVHVRRIEADGNAGRWVAYPLIADESYRFIIARGSEPERRVEVAIPPGISSHLHEVFDRAHYPTLSVEDIGLTSDRGTPLPEYREHRH